MRKPTSHQSTLIICVVVLLTALALNACNRNPNRSDSTPTVNNQPTLPALADSLTTEPTCRAARGNWQRVGRLQAFACVLPTQDAGKPCQDGKECQVACIWQGQDVAPGTQVSGQCHNSTNLFGCLTHVTRGKAEATLCID